MFGSGRRYPEFARAAGVAGLAFVVMGGAAQAQAVGRSHPVERPAPTVAQSQPVPLTFSETAIVTSNPPALSGLVMLEPTADMASRDLPQLSPTQLRATALPYMGQPISPQMISAIESDLSRRLGAPVRVQWAPDQDISSGVLAFHIARFVAGRVTATGGQPGEAARVVARLKLQSGQPVDSRKLAYDLDTLNRYPFRQVQAKAHAAASPDTADVDLTVTDTKPWQANFGFKYTGSDVYTWRRYYGGVTAGNLLGQDSVLSLQGTASPDVLGGAKHPILADITLAYTVPVTRHGSFEASLESTDFTFDYPPTKYWIDDVLGAFGFRFAIPNSYSGTGSSDIRYGVEVKHERGTTVTGGIVTGVLGTEVYQVYAGYHHGWDTASGHDDLDVSARFSPGGLDAGNSDAHYAVYTDGRVTSARYSYLDLTYDHTARLSPSLAWHGQVVGQVSSDPLPYSEQWSLGGLNFVRGYGLYDGSFDDFLVVRNDIGLGGPTDAAIDPAPFVFVDVGVGRDIYLKQNTTLASAGFGTVFQLNKHTSLRLDIARAFIRGGRTPVGTLSLEANLQARF